MHHNNGYFVDVLDEAPKTPLDRSNLVGALSRSDIQIGDQVTVHYGEILTCDYIVLSEPNTLGRLSRCHYAESDSPFLRMKVLLSDYFEDYTHGGVIIGPFDPSHTCEAYLHEMGIIEGAGWHPYHYSTLTKHFSVRSVSLDFHTH